MEVASEPNARIFLKNGKEANWAVVDDFIPGKGEIIIYNPDATHSNPRIKVGNGVDLPRDLPFIDAGSISGLDIDNLVAKKVGHKLTFGSGGVYQFDGSADVTVPVYTGGYAVNPEEPDVGYQEQNFSDD